MNIGMKEDMGVADKWRCWFWDRAQAARKNALI